MSDLKPSNFIYIDPLSLPELADQSLLNSNHSAGIIIEPHGDERQFLRYCPEFVDDPGATGPFAGLSTAVYSSPPNFVCAASGATLIGFRTAILGQNFFVDQSFGENSENFLSRLGSNEQYFNEDMKIRRIEKSRTFAIELGPEGKRHIEGPAIALSSIEPSNYGSFIFRVLPKLIAIARYNLKDMPILVYVGPSSFIALLEFMGVNPSRIIRHNTRVVTHVERLIYPSMRNPSAFLDYESRMMFRSLRSQVVKRDAPARRIYISRLSHGINNARATRKMLNEEQLICHLKNLGIEIIEPETLSMEQQIQAFAAAELVIGPSGGAMFNTVFCRPGTKVIDIESEPHWIYAHAGLFASCELRYGIFVGEQNLADERTTHRSWTVNIGALLERIKKFN